ncbi:MAG: hypothetical protein FDW93_06410 [Bergeyella sp.]|nr:hypothetical protein [Bergeyella sp.]
MKTSIRGSLNTLEVDETIEFPKKKYLPSSVRSSAASLKMDTGKAFNVNATPKKVIRVTRIQ